MSIKNRSSKGFVIAGALVAGLIVAGASLASAGAVDNDWNTPAQGQTQNQSQTQASERQTPKCLDMREMGRTHVVDDHTLLVYDHMGNPYKLDIGGPCRSMTDMSHFGFDINGSSQLCRAHDAKLLYSSAGEPYVRCLINGVKPLTRAEAEALDND